jgi:hypothetical protein
MGGTVPAFARREPLRGARRRLRTYQTRGAWVAHLALPALVAGGCAIPEDSLDQAVLALAEPAESNKLRPDPERYIVAFRKNGKGAGLAALRAVSDPFPS